VTCEDDCGVAITGGLRVSKREPACSDITDGSYSFPSDARNVAVEIKRKAGIDAVEQLSRYLELLNRDMLLAPVRGILAAQTIVPQARTLAEDRGITCVVVDYDALRGLDDPEHRLF
jgi:RecB family endonuclease NucS